MCDAILISIAILYSLKYGGGTNEAFPQVIYYDGKHLIATPLCTTWYQYIYSEFYAGGLDLENGYNMMHQMVNRILHYLVLFDMDLLNSKPNKMEIVFALVKLRLIDSTF